MIAALLIGCASVFIATSWHMYHVALADLWQHLAALNAIIDDPFSPSNPFVDSDRPSRLFGPYWIFVGGIASFVGLTAPQAFVLGGIFNLILLAVSIWILGRALHGGAIGALALLAALIGGWLLGPNFTGYHTPLTLLSSTGYPAITAVAAALILWGLSINYMRGDSSGIIILVIVALAFATHPLGTSVGLAGAGLIALSTPDRTQGQRIRLLAWLAGGLVASATWPYFNPVEVFRSAGSASWSVGIDFYNPLWIASSLFPAAIGIVALMRREMRPFLLLFIACSIGFAAGATPYFVAGHRLLSFMALVLHIGLSFILIDLFRSRTRLGRTGQAFALYVAVISAVWTATKLDELQAQARREGNLLHAAEVLTKGTDGGFAGLLSASFPIAATGRRVLSTPFAEPLVEDFEERQAATEALFDPALGAAKRVELARRSRVRYLVVNVRHTPPTLVRQLATDAASVKQSGVLLRFQLY